MRKACLVALSLALVLSVSSPALAQDGAPQYEPDQYPPDPCQYPPDPSQYPDGECNTAQTAGVPGNIGEEVGETIEGDPADGSNDPAAFNEAIGAANSAGAGEGEVAQAADPGNEEDGTAGEGSPRDEDAPAGEAAEDAPRDGAGDGGGAREGDDNSEPAEAATTTLPNTGGGGGSLAPLGGAGAALLLVAAGLVVGRVVR